MVETSDYYLVIGESVLHQPSNAHIDEAAAAGRLAGSEGGMGTNELSHSVPHMSRNRGAVLRLYCAR